MNQFKKQGCADPLLYSRLAGGLAPAEGRAIVIAQFVESELEAQKAQIVRDHLRECEYCSDYEQDLRTEDASMAVTYAVCPSSETWDEYLFRRDSLSGNSVTLLTQHLEQCPLCAEEIEWLRNLESQQVVEFSPRRPRLRLQKISVAAALIFLLIASILWMQRLREVVPEQELRALAVVQEPDEIDYAGLKRTATPLSAELESLYNQSAEAIRNRDFQTAEKGLLKVLEASPQHSASLFLLGYTYYQLDHPEKAFELCDRAEQIEPHSYERCMSLVHVALKTGHFSRAVQEISVLYHEAGHIPEVRDLYFRIMKLTKGKKLEI